MKRSETAQETYKTILSRPTFALEGSQKRREKTSLTYGSRKTRVPDKMNIKRLTPRPIIIKVSKVRQEHLKHSKRKTSW